MSLACSLTTLSLITSGLVCIHHNEESFMLFHLLPLTYKLSDTTEVSNNGYKFIDSDGESVELQPHNVTNGPDGGHVLLLRPKADQQFIFLINVI